MEKPVEQNEFLYDDWTGRYIDNPDICGEPKKKTIAEHKKEQEIELKVLRKVTWLLNKTAERELAETFSEGERRHLKRAYSESFNVIDIISRDCKEW